ncbi:Fyv7/TAP26 [Dillenia turbinata]|uniref:Fyv7/TAP26 n=1 Tax=Dillenia turbinata TaxID=194707 RepID=A0AAN8W6M7_9MAGN
MKNRNPKGRNNGSDQLIKKKNTMMTKKKNMQRLGSKGGGLSLEAFANAKSNGGTYNPSLIKKQREFYKNAKYVKKYKKYLKQQDGQPNYPSSDTKRENIFDDTGAVVRDKKGKKNKNSSSLELLYEKKHEEQENARMEREAIIQAKKEDRVRAESRRKELREKMLKRTRSGQPVMKYRIEHLLETIQGSKS